jgi:diaminohydroxyphosphoribosylaminopyrimidine deaminase/5-amino-6-(5-phosphoribosylamino)uracil reductase
MEPIYRIATTRAWLEAIRTGTLPPSPLDQRDGFLHCSRGAQVAATLRVHFAGQSELVLLHVDPQRLAAGALRFEPARDGEPFPHLYGALPEKAVLRAEPLLAGPAGFPVLDPGFGETAHVARPDDARWMSRAVALAMPGVGQTGLNPSVGCVVVKAGRVLGEAATAAGGRPHAEEQALVALADADLTQATAYVTLEPCSERSNGTASCSVRLVQQRVARVVVACSDPSAYAAGGGITRLRRAGIDVELGLLAEEADAALYLAYRARLASV